MVQKSTLLTAAVPSPVNERCLATAKQSLIQGARKKVVVRDDSGSARMFLTPIVEENHNTPGFERT
jgi:hypothetical protein